MRRFVRVERMRANHVKVRTEVGGSQPIQNLHDNRCHSSNPKRSVHPQDALVRTRQAFSGAAAGPLCQYMPPRTLEASASASSYASSVATESIYCRVASAWRSSIKISWYVLVVLNFIPKNATIPPPAATCTRQHPSLPLHGSATPIRTCPVAATATRHWRRSPYRVIAREVTASHRLH